MGLVVDIVVKVPFMFSNASFILGCKHIPISLSNMLEVQKEYEIWGS